MDYTKKTKFKLANGMFEAITNNFENVFRKLRGKGRLTESNIKEGLHEVRLALLEADVNYRVVKDFIQHVTDRAVGEEVIKVLHPDSRSSRSFMTNWLS